MIDRAVVELEPHVCTARACALLGKSRATLYRSRRPAVLRPPGPRRTPANALRPPERKAVMDVLHGDDYLDLAVAQVWARELDEGRYHCSMSTMYRLLREHRESRERRRQASHPSRTRPELVATAPNEVWTYDITMLKAHGAACTTPCTRSSTSSAATCPATWWPPSSPQSSWSACSSGPWPNNASNRERTRRPGRRAQPQPPARVERQPVRGGELQDLEVLSAVPERFDSVVHAREFCAWFFNAYNHEHRHSALGWHTPASVHFGTAPEIRAARQATLDAAFAAHPQRFGRAPVAPKLPTVAWINEPQREVIHSK